MLSGVAGIAAGVIPFVAQRVTREDLLNAEPDGDCRSGQGFVLRQQSHRGFFLIGQPERYKRCGIEPGIRLQCMGSGARGSQLLKLLQSVEQFLIFRLALDERGFEILDDFGGSLAAEALVGEALLFRFDVFF